MIKIYGSKNCPMCKTLEFWCDKVALETNYELVETKELQKQLEDDYNITGYPVVIVDNKQITFNDCMELFKKNRK